MTFTGQISVFVATLCGGLVAAHFAWSQGVHSNSHSQTNDRERIVLSKALSKLDGNHLRAVLVEVRYARGETSLPHTHPCAVFGYVVEGALRTQVKGQQEVIYKAGEGFYEVPNGVHLIPANASFTEPAKFVAYFICDRETPLSADVSESIHPKGPPR